MTKMPKEENNQAGQHLFASSGSSLHVTSLNNKYFEKSLLFESLNNLRRKISERTAYIFLSFFVVVEYK